MAIVRIQLRRDTAADWTSANPILAEGEMGIETDTDLFKIGNGSTAWTSLGYGGLQGIAAATAPITYDSGTQTVGIDESAISINASQISDLTATAAELNILDGVTATAAELNILDGATVTAAELNILDGATVSTTELNYVDGVTSNIQTQLDSKEPLQRTVGVETGAHTLDITDAKKTIVAIGALTVTVPDAVFSAGHRIDFIQDGADPITFAAGAGVTINSKGGALSTSAQYAAASIFFADASTAYLVGDLA